MSLYGQKLPYFLFGHSMGGAMAYHLSLENPLAYKGAILLAPALMNIAGSFIKGLVEVLALIAHDKPIIPMGGREANFKSPHVLYNYLKDELVY